ncbi:MAG: hypothetical protein ACKOCX_11115 [Planctomycetota bacterium]
MALRAFSRRDQRRRLLASRNRAAEGATTGEPGAGGGAATSYDDEAHPERHPALATRLPVGMGRFLLAASGILLVFGGAIALGVSGPLFGRPLLPEGGRFGRTLAVLAAGFDPRGAMPVQVWLAELALVLAAAVAGAVRFMRRHRRDDYKGRFRAWGWLAVLLTIAAWAGAVPLGRLVSAVVADATGIVPGPDGIGWWLGLAATSFMIVVPWAVLPLRERAATSVWMVLAMGAWGVAAAMPWGAEWVGGAARAAIVAQSAWAAGAGLLLVALLAAARSVIREVRGQCAARPARPARRDRQRQEAATESAAGRDSEEHEDDFGGSDDDARDDAEAADLISDETDFTDGSERGQRRLSKAERKRLKKLARMNGHAA